MNMSINKELVEIPSKDGGIYYIHKSAYVDEGAEIGSETKIWHFSHVMSGARIGKKCSIGQNVNVGGSAIIGNGVNAMRKRGLTPYGPADF